MKISLDIDVQQAQKDCKIVEQFKQLLDDFDRLKSAIIYKEISDNNDLPKDFFKDLKEKTGCKQPNIEIKEVNNFEDLKEMLKSLFE